MYKSLIIALLALFFAACGSDEPTPPNPNPNPNPGTFTVTFDLNAGDAQRQPDAQNIQGDSTVARPLNPTRPGYLFAGWFTDRGGQNEFNFEAPITAPITLYARWEEIPEKFWIPDDNFRDTLKAQIPAAFDERDSLLTQHADVKGLATLNIASSSIADLTGIAYFTALKELNGDNNELTTLDVSQNAALTTLFCSENQLTTLDVSQNAALTSLQCGGNDLTSLNVLQNAALTSLECNDNQLATLDVSQNAALTELDCGNNQLTELDIRGMRSATELVIGLLADANPLKIRVHESLKDHQELKTVKTQRGDRLTLSTYRAASGSTDYTLVCGDYDPTAGECLVTVTFEANGGSVVNAQKVALGQPATAPLNPIREGYIFEGWFIDPALEKAFHFDTRIDGDIALYARWKKIPEKFFIPDKAFRDTLKLIISDAFNGDSLLVQSPQVKGFKSLDVRSRGIVDLEGIEYFTALEQLICVYNPLASLDVSKNTALTALACSANQLTELDVSQNIRLTDLDCSENQLTELNVSQNAALTFLRCDGNNLTELNVSQNAALTFLNCGDNDLTRLDITQNAALTFLRCNDNDLTRLDVLQNTKLTNLYCENNELMSLDVAQNIALDVFNCSDNQLTELDMRGMRSVGFFGALQIGATTSASNPLMKLLVHENLQDHDEVKEAKTVRGDALVIETYRAAAGSTDYMRVCADYDPNEGDDGACKDTP